MDRQAYLERIGYAGALAPTLETLRGLHRAHLLTVPFENLDIPHRPIVLDEARLFEKIVTRRRGGFCYELNGLFAWLLRDLGYQVTLLSARVMGQDGLGPEFDHLALRVQLEDAWLADVGFGDSYVLPPKLEAGYVYPEARSAYRIAQDGEQWALEERAFQQSDWSPQHYFTLIPRRLSDFDEMCRYHQSSPDSPFTKRRVCSRATETGRITLRDDRLIITDGGERRETPIDDAQAYADALEAHFGINEGTLYG
jgi:N-hydroxyarylamine O-acetyltransferase